jgi:uncharacterized protein DUF5666
MEKKPSAKKRLIMAGILTLTLVAFFAGGIVLSSAHAVSMGKPGQQGTPGPANGAKAPGTPGPANGAKAPRPANVANLSGTITKIDGSTITVQAKDQTSTILVTGSTTFSKGHLDLQTNTKSSQPASFSDLAVGETIQAEGNLNSDGSRTASHVVIVPSDGGTPSGGGTK